MLHFKCVQVRTVVTHIGWFLGPKKQDHFETERFWETNLKHKRNNNLIFFFFSIRSFTYCSLNHTHPWPLQYFSSSIANKSRSIPKYLNCRWIFSSGWKLKTCNLQFRSKTFKTYHYPVNSPSKLCFNSVHLYILNRSSVYKSCLIQIHTWTLVF